MLPWFKLQIYFFFFKQHLFQFTFFQILTMPPHTHSLYPLPERRQSEFRANLERIYSEFIAKARMPHFCRFFRFFLGGRVAGQDNKPVPSGHLVSAWWVPIGHLWQNAPRLSLLRDRIETIMEISKIILIFATCSRRYFSPMASVYLSEYMNVSSYSGRLDFTRRYSIWQH